MILFAIIIIPLLAAILSILIRRSHIGSAITLTGALVTFIFSILALYKILTTPEHIIIGIAGWISMDSLGMIILFLISFTNLTAVLFSSGYMKYNKKGCEEWRYYFHYNLFVFSMLIIPMIQEPNIIWIAVELTTLFSVLLVGFTNTHEALEAAWKYVVLTIMGAAIALLGFLILYWAAKNAGVDSYTWSGLIAISPKMSPVLLKSAFIFILVGFGAKIGLVPLHTWLPDAYSQAPTPICTLLSGVEITTVLYVLLRLLPIMYGASILNINTWLIIFGLISAGAASFLLLRVRDYKRLMAFSSIEHMGIILVAIGISGTNVHIATLLQIISHSVTKSFCFYAAGTVFLLIGSRQINSVRGLIIKSPASAIALLFGGLAIAGSPPFAVFLSEFLIIKSGLSQGKYIAVGLLLIFIAIAFFAIMYHISRMVFGSNDKAISSLGKVHPINYIALIIAAIPVIALGIYIPEPLQKLITLAAQKIGG